MDFGWRRAQPTSHQGLSQAPVPVPGAVLLAQDPPQLCSPSDLHFCGHCSWRHFETTPGEDDVLKQCENSGHHGGTSQRDGELGPPGHPRPSHKASRMSFTQGCLSSSPGCLCQTICQHSPSLPATARDLHNRAHLTGAGIFLPGVKL